MANRATKPIEQISATARKIANGNLKERIEPAGGVRELDSLSRVLNHTFDLLHAVYERQREFTSDAAHEVRTPLTVPSLETQRMLKRPRSAEEYQAAFRTCEAALTRMKRVVEELLFLARQDAPMEEHARCDMRRLIEEAVGHISRLAQSRGMRIATRLDTAWVAGRAHDLSTLLNVILSNAVEHGGASGGELWIACRSEEDEVGDDGPGIHAEDLPFIFERFYRGNKARGGDRAFHSGLGLAMAKAIVVAHGGVIACRSEVGIKTVFRIALRRAEAVDAVRERRP